MTRKPPTNIQEFVKEYLFDREVELLKKETEIQKLQSQVSKIKNNVNYFLNNCEMRNAPLICNECFGAIVIFNPYRRIDTRVKCSHCSKIVVCEDCSKHIGGTMMELPHLFEYWVCEECFEKPIPKGVVSYCKVCKNSERSSEIQ